MMPGTPNARSGEVAADDRELIHSFTTPVIDKTGRSWRAQAYGRPAGNVWFGWIRFTDEDGATVETGNETSQADRDALRYWAAGVEPIYLEGALARARDLPV
jgi:hypothetical protein